MDDKKHKELVDQYWKAAEFGSTDDMYEVRREIEQFERQALKEENNNQEIKDKIVCKYLLNDD